MMGSGKSSTGKALSSILGWNFIDIDNEISNTHNLTINELFSKGEQYFRDIEYTELRKHIEFTVGRKNMENDDGLEN